MNRMEPSALCVITARGGSKRIPHKNVREFCGRPIISYSIEAALESGLFDEVMVSADDEEIAEIARACGAEVPFMRSAEASDDYATTADVLAEVLAEYRTRGREFDVLCCLYPTTPFVTAVELRGAAGCDCAVGDPGSWSDMMTGCGGMGVSVVWTPYRESHPRFIRRCRPSAPCCARVFFLTSPSLRAMAERGLMGSDDAHELEQEMKAGLSCVSSTLFRQNRRHNFDIFGVFMPISSFLLLPF